MATIGGHNSANINYQSEIIEVVSIVSDTITLTKTPVEDSEFIFLNGLCLAQGASYDYLINDAVIIFNLGVLTNDGHVLIKYNY